MKKHPRAIPREGRPSMALPSDHRHRKVQIQPIKERDAAPIEEVPIDPNLDGPARLVVEQVNALIREHNES